MVKNSGNKHEKDRVIRGKIVDEMGEGISYASIFIKGTTIGVAADSAGRFSLKYSGQKRTIVLVTSSIGFEEVETEVDLTDVDKSITTALPPDNILKEVIVVAGYEITCTRTIMGGAFIAGKTVTFIDTVWNKFFPAMQTSTIYPNPVRINSLLNIRTGKDENGMYLFQLSAVNGQIVLSKELWIEKNTRVVNINIPSVAAGGYFLQIINKQSGKRTTEKIIVE